MKKIIKTLMCALFAIVMALSFTGCDKDSDSGKSKKKDDGIDYQRMIDSFVPDNFNVIELKVGEEDGPQARIWLQNGNGTVYSSDESVVTITDLGKVTAVGEGSAYIVITGNKGELFQVYRYDVSEEVPEADLSHLPTIEGVDLALEIATFNPTELNTFELKVGDDHTPTASVWANSGTCYTTDESVVTVAENGNVSAVGKGTAYVVIKAGIGDMFEIYKYIVSDSNTVSA